MAPTPYNILDRLLKLLLSLSTTVLKALLNLFYLSRSAVKKGLTAMKIKRRSSAGYEACNEASNKNSETVSLTDTPHSASRARVSKQDNGKRVYQTLTSADGSIRPAVHTPTYGSGSGPVYETTASGGPAVYNPTGT